MSSYLGRDCVDKIAFGLADACASASSDLTLLEHKWLFWLSVTTATAFLALALLRITHLILRYPRTTATLTFACIRLGLLAISIRQSHGSHQRSRWVASTALDFAASLLLLVLSTLEHFKSVRPSILACAFIVLAFIYDVSRIPSLWSGSLHLDPGRLSSAFKALFTAVVPIEFIFLALESSRRRSWVIWDKVNHSPEETSSVLGLGVYAWLNPLLWRGYHESLTMKHLFALDGNISVDIIQEKSLTDSSSDSTGTSSWQLILWLVKPLGRFLILPVLPRLFLLGFTFCQPFFIQRLLRFLSSPEDNSLTASALISVAVFTYLGIAISTALYWYYQERFQSMLRAYLISSIYQKAGLMVHVGDGDHAAVTLMGADVERVYTGLRLMHEVWADAIQIPLALWLLQLQLGLAFLAPLAVVLIGFCFSFFISKRAVPNQAAWMARVQARTEVTAGMLSHIKDLRISGMSVPASVLVKHERETEIDVGERSRTVTAISASLSQLPQAIAPALAFAFGPHAIDQSRAFTALSLLGLLTSPLLMILQILPIIAAAFACLRRIRTFLVQSGRIDNRILELQSHGNNEKAEKQHEIQDPSVRICDGSFGWTQENLVLKNINLQLLKSSITFILGPVASGKSTLCRALLGEVPFAQGTVALKSAKLAYCDQAPFLFNASIVDNIIGFSSFDTARYADVIEATMLVEDLASLPQGDKTIVGQKGTSLSGGQRQRVSLARALYHDAEILLLDDIFSGLDGSTQKRVCQSVLGPAGLLRRRGTTTILCTRARQFLSVADYIVTLSSHGTVVDQGTLSEISKDSKRIQRLGLVDIFEADAQIAKQTLESCGVTIEEAKTSSKEDSKDALQTLTGPCSVPAGTPSVTMPIADMGLYRHWLSTIGLWPLLIFLVLIVGNGFGSNFPTIWLKLWSSDSTSTSPDHPFAYWIGIYALLGASSVLCVFPAGLIMLRTGVRLTGTSLHHAAIETIMHSSFRFLSTTDVGKVLNLLSQDMNILDIQLPRIVNNMAFTLSNAVGQAVVIAVSSAWLAVSYPVFIAMLWAVQRVYLPTSKRLRILDLEAKSPLYTNFLDTVKGLPTIRAFGWFPQQQARNNVLLDNSQRPSYLLAMAQQWLMLTMNVIVAILAVILVALVTLMSLGSTLTTVIVAYTGLETSLGAIARLKSFGEKTELERTKTESAKLDKGWPATGEMRVNKVAVSYTGTERVLEELSLFFKPGEKIAICGRTGSGKSTILALLLRLIEPVSATPRNPAEENPITIDGISLSTVDQTQLRERILATSQDAVFLPDNNSTFRANLDPWGIALTAECLTVLHDLDLTAIVEAKGGLDAPISGAELSSGQKQLFGFARVLLRRLVKIRETDIDGGLLLLDEITPSADADTERRMMRALLDRFEKYTVVMVTHHREVAVACGRVVVLDKGRVVEDGSPEELLGREGGWFRTLWESHDAA
ncbi:P-loop containing nucleoside triphosphate hydrolase protein [Leptodontidium sp. 2 PMI_412]|nr:P-loop containing nucleoside triphosphate hydrolase protein [Leptodontidium sp. 2 PMI_412]